MRIGKIVFLAVAALAAVNGAAQERPLGKPRVMQGPMLGDVTPTSITIWMRLSAPVAASVSFGRDPTLRDATIATEVIARREDDRCVAIRIDGLEPATRYHWMPLVLGAPDPYLAGQGPFTFDTAPAGPARSRIAFGSCARIQSDPVQPIWTAVQTQRPDVFLWLGDNVYADTDDADVIAEEYRRQRDVPLLRPLLRTIPQLAIWDDHDFGLNNHDRTNPVAAAARRVFGRYWANPAAGTTDTLGVFFRWSFGGVDYFFLDDRTHRDPNRDPDVADKTMLGAGQLAWLQRELRASRAPFKLLVSGSGWSAAKGPGGDSWASYLHERDALFAWIAAESIGGVVLLSGDTHVAELNCIPWSERGGYDFYDLVSSPLAQRPETSWRNRHPEVRVRPVHAASPNFGVLDIDTTEADPSLRFTVRDVLGATVWAPFVLHASDLAPGVRSWDRLRSADADGPSSRARCP